MIRVFIGIVGLAIFFVALSSEALGQRIFVGPGGISVGTKDVQVDLFGRRGHHVVEEPVHYYRSDWRDVWYGDTHWDRWATDFDELPPLPDSNELTFMSWKHLRRVLRFATTHFDDQLDSLRTGAGWRKHLQVGAIRDQVAEDINSPPDRAARMRLYEILDAYNATARNPEYVSVSDLWGFRAVHSALDEFVALPWMRERRQLAASANQLDRELQGISGGRRWREHLALPDHVFASAPAPNSSGSARAPDLRQLRKALARFDSVSRKPKYRSIAALPSFQATHEILASYINHFVSAPPPPPTH